MKGKRRRSRSDSEHHDDDRGTSWREEEKRLKLQRKLGRDLFEGDTQVKKRRERATDRQEWEMPGVTSSSSSSHFFFFPEEESEGSRREIPFLPHLFLQETRDESSETESLLVTLKEREGERIDWAVEAVLYRFLSSSGRLFYSFHSISTSLTFQPFSVSSGASSLPPSLLHLNCISSPSSSLVVNSLSLAVVSWDGCHDHEEWMTSI